MIYENVLIRSLEELHKTNIQCRHALIEEAKSKEKGTFPIVYKYMGTRNTRRLENNIQQEDVIGEMTNIRQDETTGDVTCDVTIYDVKKDSVNFDFKIDNFVINICDGKESIVNGIIYNKYAKHVIDTKRKLESSKYVEKVEPSPVPDEVAEDKTNNPLFDPDVRKSIHESIQDMVKGGEPNE